MMRGGDNITAVVECERSDSNLPITDNNDGTYSVVWTPAASGAARVAVRVYDEAINGSHIAFEVAPAHT